MESDELETKKLKVSKELEKEIELICRFASTRYETNYIMSRLFLIKNK